MGLTLLILGLAVFIGTHVITTRRALRAGIIDRVGDGPYKAIYSVASILGVILIVYGFGQYRAAGYIALWNPPAWTRHVTVALVWPAIICFCAAYSPGRIKTTLKHPLLVGTKLWALAHLISNGDLGSVILFGSILGWAVFDRITLKRRTDPGAPPIPVGGIGKDIMAVVVGTVIYLVLGLVHPYMIGVPAFSK
jgi:uncharacterized membrane protein